MEENQTKQRLTSILFSKVQYGPAVYSQTVFISTKD